MKKVKIRFKEAVIYKGNFYGKGEVFSLDKETAEKLVNARLGFVIEERSNEKKEKRDAVVEKDKTENVSIRKPINENSQEQKAIQQKKRKRENKKGDK